MSKKTQILVILSRFPYPLEKGDKLRAYHQLVDLSNYYDVTLVAITDKPIAEKSVNEVEKICSELIVERITALSKIIGMLVAFLNGRPFQTGYFYRQKIANRVKSIIQEKDIKHIYCQLVRTGEYAKNIHTITKTLDYMDVLSLGIDRRIDLQPFYKRWLFKIESKRLRIYERQLFDYFENKLIISKQDQQHISHPEKSRITVIPNGVDNTFFEEIPRPELYDFVFVGNMSYPPNIEAVQYIAKHILPKFPTATFLISGATPHAIVQQLAEHPQITIQGWVDDIRESYVNGKIFLAPMMIGTGMQNKLLEAMALKTPCITTSLANDAIGMKNKTEIVVANSVEEMVSSISELLENPLKRQEIAQNAYLKVKSNFNWVESNKKLIQLIDSAIQSKNKQ